MEHDDERSIKEQVFSSVTGISLSSPKRVPRSTWAMLCRVMIFMRLLMVRALWSGSMSSGRRTGKPHSLPRKKSQTGPVKIKSTCQVRKRPGRCFVLVFTGRAKPSPRGAPCAYPCIRG